MQIGLLLFDQVDLLDVAGPYEVFLTANRLARRRGLVKPFDVFTIGVSPSPIESYGGLGTVDIDTTSADERVTSAIRSLAESATLMTDVRALPRLETASGAHIGHQWASESVRSPEKMSG